MATLTAHQANALEYKKHISLTANAGSGKTFVLATRYLKIVIEEDISLRSIAAITFTDKAAGELYSKIAKQIDEKISAAADSKEKRKLENIRSQLVSANISTIHSFCIDILREHPVEAGLDANFTAIDERTSNELIELSVEEMIKSVIKDEKNAEGLKYLIRLFASKNLFAKEVISLIKERKNVLGISERIYSKTEEEIAAFFSNTFHEFTERIFAYRIPSLTNALKEVNEAVLSSNKDNQRAIEVRASLEKLSSSTKFIELIAPLKKIEEQIILKDGIVRTQGYSSKIKGEFESEILLINIFFKDFKAIDLSEDTGKIELELARFGKKIIFYFSLALENYFKKKSEQGFLDYEDILLYTKKILELEVVRQAISEKYKYIMIDEYQDTNEIQYNIFLPILDELKKGNLFVVGDEKQSIYMFRDAELEVFDLTKKNIESVSGKESLMTLPDSFRMAPAICLFTNLLFRNLFDKPEILFNEVVHSDLVCARQDDSPGKIEILLSKENENLEDEDESEDNDYEADVVARRILKLIYQENREKIISWKDMAVLCRKRKYFTELEKTFTKYDIPFIILGGKDFYRRQAIYDIYNYFSFLADDKNDASLVGILRSPFFSLSDSIIYEISLQPGYSFWAKLCNYKNILSELNYVVEILRENLKLAKNSGVVLLLRKILNESAFLSVIASKPGGAQDLANIEKLVKLTINLFAQGFKTLYDYVVFLRDSIEEAGDEPQAAISEEADAVVIMTLHQSKGLEYPIVFLYKCDDRPNTNIVKSRSVVVSKNFGLLAKVPLENNFSAKPESAPIIKINDWITAKKQTAEIKRLLYVGITRAKDYLFISAAKKKNNKYNEGSFMSLIQNGLDLDLDASAFSTAADLKSLKIGNENFDYRIKKINLDIPIINEIELAEENKEEIKPDNSIKKINIVEIEDVQKGEIVSATKLSVYKQCPLKYYLTYDAGFSPLYRRYKKWLAERRGSVRYEFNESEDKNLAILREDPAEEKRKEFSDVKGRIIHKILQLETPLNQAESLTEELLKSELEFSEKKEDVLRSLKREIVRDLSIFYSSANYKELNKYSNYKNEFEIYSKENDYFLYGIIDKLIIDGDRAIIVDYKTDDIGEEKIEEKIKSYLPQLEFYALLVSKLNSSFNKFEIRLIFITQPERSFQKVSDAKDILSIKTELEKMVLDVRRQVFPKNLKHCSKCSFSNNHGFCIVG